MMWIGIVSNCISPFFYEIENYELPTKFNAYKCPDYFGTKDLVTHVKHFKTTMDLMSLT